jgi:cysteine desulfurase
LKFTSEAIKLQRKKFYQPERYNYQNSIRIMTDNRVYLDYSATCPMDPQVNEAVYQWNRQHRGNPSSPHRFGQEARIKLEETRDILAETAGCLPAEIIFTSGGTESNNLALIGTARALASRGKHIIISAVEHPSILECCAHLQQVGFDISYVAPDAQGFLDPSSIRRLIKSDTILVSVMYVNNETGIIHPVAEIGQLCRDRGVIFHCDAVQALGKIPFAFNELPVDMMSISGHKIYGPTGIGALIVKKGRPLENIHFGGGQEAARRPGTENMSGIVGFGEALRCLKNHSRMSSIACKFCNPVLKSVSKPSLRTPGSSELAGNVRLSFPAWPFPVWIIRVFYLIWIWPVLPFQWVRPAAPVASNNPMCLRPWD